MQDAILENRCRNAVRINEENLFTLIHDNKDTSFGKRHGFSNIITMEQFRHNLPITEYSDYKADIEQMRTGADNILTAYPIAGYCKTSGTEGRVKFIPVTYKALESYSDQSERYPKYIIDQAGGGKRLYINIFSTEPGKLDDRPLLFSELYNAWLCEKGLLDTSTQAGGSSFLFERMRQDSLYAKVSIAFLTEDLVTIEAPFMYDILHFFSYMEYNWRWILENLRNHKIPPHIELSPAIRDTLIKYPIGESRFEEIETECEKGFENIARRLWKKLSLISGISSRAYSSEDRALHFYTGDIRRQHLCYCSSECYIGAPLKDNDFCYVLLPNSGFFEFLPYGKENDGTLLPHELKQGELYEPIITNFSGLYRYRMGDVIRVTGFYYESPMFEFSFRRNQAINIAGEKMSVKQLEEAIEKIKEEVFVETYCFGASTLSIPSYYFAVAVIKSEKTEKECAGLLDDALSVVNEDYRDLRDLKKLAPPLFFCLNRKQYESLMKNNFSQHRHNKPVHVFKQESTELILKEIKKL